MTFPSQEQRLESRPVQAIVGKSEHAINMRAFARKASTTNRTILLLGETGGGKDHLAETIHSLGGENRPFVHLNCGGFPEHLLESELFGHTRGAFTDARREKLGLFEAAENGTIFFDEIANMPPTLQARILRVIEKKSFRKLGSVAEVSVQTRIIVATNANIQERIRKGEFRDDLYYRINTLSFTILPLRDRTEDIPQLAEHFLQKDGSRKRLTYPALKALTKYHWPGNVRELGNVMDRAAFNTGTDHEIGPEHIEPYLTGAPILEKGEGERKEEEEEVFVGRLLQQPFDAVERLYFEKLIIKTGGHQAKAAKVAGLTARVMGYRLRSLGLQSLVRTLKD